jgi:hypothetical protein
VSLNLKSSKKARLRKKKRQNNLPETGWAARWAAHFYLTFGGLVLQRIWVQSDRLTLPWGEGVLSALEEAAMQKLDLKKTLKAYYEAKSAPIFVEVPAMNFLMIDGAGNPNTSADYAEIVQTLYSVAYTLKFKVKKEIAIDYPVMALEGLWWGQDMNLFSAEKKEAWLWTMMISTPDFITPELVETAKVEARKKKSLPALPRLRFASFTEGFSAQLMHIGPYSAEAENIRRLHDFIRANGYAFDGKTQKHHEIYLSDPRKAAPEKLKTIIRQPVRSGSG